MTTKEAAKALGVSTDHVCLLLRRNVLEGKRIPDSHNAYRYRWMVYKHSVDKYKKQQQKETQK